jgi:hypothetical protein
MGDAELSGFGGQLLDDMAPEMAKILYVIKVRAVQYRLVDEEELLIVDRVKKIRIKPAYEEHPPLNVDAADSGYRLRAEKSIRKSMFKGKSGTLVMEAQQPKSLRIPGARTDDAPASITTVARVSLRFDPTDEHAQPPKLGSLSSKIKASTYHATTPLKDFPTKRTLALDLTQGVYSVTIPLSSRCVTQAVWQKHDSSTGTLEPARRDSGASLLDTPFDIPQPSSTYTGKTFYAAQILVPISLPTNRNFLPTFHACLISRVYTLSLSLSLGGSASISNLSLKVPVQISAEGSADGNEALEHANATDEVDDLFRPRNVAPPQDEYIGRSSVGADRGSDLPPGYQFNPARGHVSVSVHA